MAQSLASAALQHSLSNSGARADLIRSAVHWLAEREAEVQALNAEIREYKERHIKGQLGFKIRDWNAVYRVSQLEPEAKDMLLDTVREGFAALGIGGTIDWVEAAQAAPRQRPNGVVAAPDPAAHAAGRADALNGNRDNAARWPAGELGHADYELGHREGEIERDRVMALGYADDVDAAGFPMAPGFEQPKRGRGRPKKQKPEEPSAEA